MLICEICLQKRDKSLENPFFTNRENYSTWYGYEVSQEVFILWSYYVTTIFYLPNIQNRLAVITVKINKFRLQRISRHAAPL